MVTHILSDGKKVDSIEGLVIPITGPTAAVYRIVAEFAKNRQKESYKKKEVKADGPA